MNALESFTQKMRFERLPEVAIETFAHFYGQLVAGNGAVIPESDLVPVEPDQVESLESLQRYRPQGAEAIEKTVVTKLNGGLGTTMGLDGPKSLFEAKGGLSFLDIIIRQMQHMNKKLGTTIPLVLMNSFFTDSATLDVLGAYSEMDRGSIYSFVQHKFPKVHAATLEPAFSPTQRLLEWNPAGHGDLLLALETSGLLKRLLAAGYRYFFVSNIDNLSARIDTGVLGYFHNERLDFLMEVTERTPLDRKGGHLARFKNGRLLLREASQCDHGDRPSCTNIERHPFFNTNNLWINLESVQRIVEEKKLIHFPFIINRKRFNPLDPASPEVYQLESALGSAITLFERSAAVKVPRSRFAPVKNCEDIFLLWSDYYVMEDDFRISVNPKRKSQNIEISLDPAFYSGIDSLRSRFPYGAPSLVDCGSLALKGDIKFGRNVAIRGAVSITNTRSGQVSIENDREITHDLVFD